MYQKQITLNNQKQQQKRQDQQQKQGQQYKQIASLSAPGKVILCGEHAVVYGQDALAIAISLRCKATISKNIRPKLLNSISLNKKQQQFQSTIQSNNQKQKSLQQFPSLHIIFTGTANCQITQKNLTSFQQVEYNQYLISCQKQKQKQRQHKQSTQASQQQLNKQPIQNNKPSQNEKASTQQLQMYKIMYKINIFMKQAGFNILEILSHCQNICSYKVYLQSEIPIGKCLGSSAAFNTILVATMFVIIRDLCTNNSTKQKLNLSTNIDLHQINRISKILQKVQHGTPSGIDNYVSTFGGVVLYNNSKIPPFTSINDPIIIKRLTQDIQIRLIDSKIEKNTKKAVGIVRQKFQSDLKYRQMIKKIGTFAKNILNLLKIQKQEQNQQWQYQLLSILKQNHQLLRELGVSISQIEQIVVKNTIQGLKSAKITGAGMGGYVLIAQKAKTLMEQKSSPEEYKNQQKQNSNKINIYQEIVTKIASVGLQINYT